MIKMLMMTVMFLVLLLGIMVVVMMLIMEMMLMVMMMMMLVAMEGFAEDEILISIFKIITLCYLSIMAVSSNDSSSDENNSFQTPRTWIFCCSF